MIAGKTPYSTLTLSPASRACASVSAMTTTTGSPTWQALPLASAGCAAIFIGEPSLEWIIQPQIRLPILSSASCAPLRTATTPGMPAAPLASIDLIVAWAWGGGAGGGCGGGCGVGWGSVSVVSARPSVASPVGGGRSVAGVCFYLGF